MGDPKNAISTNPAIKSADVKLPEMLFGYFVGPFGALLASGIFTSSLNKYLTDVLQLNTAFLSGLQLISTILIVAANLIVGQLIERTKSMTGKARPWILLSALTLSIGSVVMFIMPFEGIARMVWIAIAYNLFYAFAFPIYNTANSTLVPVSTRNSQQRSALASFTNIASLGVRGAGSMVFPILISNVLKEDQRMWFIVMVGVAIFTALTILLQYRFTRERVTEEALNGQSNEQEAAAPTIGDQVKAATAERWWWIAIIFYICFQWAGALKNGSMIYFCQWVVDSTPFGGDYGLVQSVLGIMGAIPMAVAAVFVVPLANKFGKRQVILIGMVVGVIGGIIAGMAGGGLVLTAAGVAVKCLGSAPAAYLILAMLADVIDHVEFKSNIRTDGLTMSIYSALMVAGTPIMNAVFMAILSAVGYVAPDAAGTVTAQTVNVEVAIGISYIWVETVAYALCALLIFMWTVEKNLPEEQAAIAERKKNG